MKTGAEFGPFDGRVWMNTAHQGPLPRAARRALEKAADQKQAPHRIPDRSFLELPQRLRSALARLIAGDPSEIVLGNSASWGLHVIAQAFPWRPGDEVAVVATDYPATIYPWLILAQRGVGIRRLRARGRFPQPDEIIRGLGPRTRLLCVTWVDSYTGYRLDIREVAARCHERNVGLVVNATQAVGAFPVNVRELGIDGLSASGFKWLCGPYATGFAWLSPTLLEILEPIQSYWLAQPDDTTIDLGSHTEPRLRSDLHARGFDVFGTANFFNFAPWLASLELLLRYGPSALAEHDSGLVGKLMDGLRDRGFQIVTPFEPASRAAIVSFEGKPGRAEQTVEQLARAGIDVAARGGHVRVSPHIHNSVADIERLLAELEGAAA